MGRRYGEFLMSDLVNHPPHYANGWSNGAEVIDITENLNFNRGNAVKYIARAGKKDPTTELQDLKKAQWYIGREISRISAQPVDTTFDNGSIAIGEFRQRIGLAAVGEAVSVWA